MKKDNFCQKLKTIETNSSKLIVMDKPEFNALIKEMIDVVETIHNQCEDNPNSIETIFGKIVASKVDKIYNKLSVNTQAFTT